MANNSFPRKNFCAKPSLSGEVSSIGAKKIFSLTDDISLHDNLSIQCGNLKALKAKKLANWEKDVSSEKAMKTI